MTETPWHPTQLPPSPDNMNSWLYWEIALAASGASSEEERKAIWSYWDFRRYGDPMGIGEGDDRTGGTPQSGYWKTKIGPKGAKRAVPAAIWWEMAHDRPSQFNLRCLVAGEIEWREIKYWEYIAREPISKETYDYWLEHKRFPGEVTTQQPEFDHNHESPYVDFRDQVIKLVGEVELEIGKIAGVFDQATADRVGNWAAMLKLSKDTCDALLKQEIGDMVGELARRRENWRILTDAVVSSITRLKALLTPYLEMQATVGGRTTAGGQIGRRSVGLRHPWVAVVEDYDAALAALADHPAVKETVHSIAQQRAKSKAKEPIPGVKFEQTTKAV